MKFDRLCGWALCAAGLALAWTVSASAATCYVNAAASGGNSGLNWGDAYTDLQSALNNAACNEVWVAQGVYKPVVPVNVGSPTNAERLVSFNVKPGVAVYGGFAGSESNRDARDPKVHPTILSGDIDNNDDANNADGNNIDETSTEIAGLNTQHILIMDGTTGAPILASTVLDGFTLTGGATTADGGALLCLGDHATHECSPTLSHLSFIGNKATDGGAAAFNGVSGGASNPTLTHVFFSGNFATTFGGAVFNNGQLGGSANPTFIDATFSANQVQSYGGAVANNGSSTAGSPVYVNVTFNGNSASLGGAMFNNGNGGGNQSSPTLTNVTFSGNSAAYGGAMYNAANGGGISNPTLNNVILWGDSATQSDDEVGGSTSNGGSFTTFIYYGVVQGDCFIGGSCSNVSSSDPKLGALTDNGGYAPTFMPGTGSSAINSVSCILAPYTDARDAPRPDPASVSLAKACDMGAVEAGSTAGDSIFADGFGAVQYH